MRKILIRSAIIALVLVQVVSIILIIDQKKTAKAQCVPVGTVVCDTSFGMNANTPDGRCGSVMFACVNNVIVSATFNAVACPSDGGDPHPSPF